MLLFDVIELPFCSVIRVEAWNAPAHRFFLAYEARGDFSHVLGLPVVDEFATFSSPIFFAPIAILGRIYNAGITLGHRRSTDMDIDSGWPPLCVGTSAPAPELPAGWEEQLISSIQSASGSHHPESLQAGSYRVAALVIDRTTVLATDAPLLPKQLRRLCQQARTPFVIAFSTGNRITRQQNGNTNEVSAVSESQLRSIQAVVVGALGDPG